MKDVFWTEVIRTVAALLSLPVALALIASYYYNKYYDEELIEICQDYELYIGNATKNNEVFNQCISSTRGVYNNALDDDIDDVIVQCRLHANAMHPTLESVRHRVPMRVIHYECRKGK